MVNVMQQVGGALGLAILVTIYGTASRGLAAAHPVLGRYRRGTGTAHPHSRHGRVVHRCRHL